MAGIISYGSYLPTHLLQRGRITEALGGFPFPGTRTVASYDEDPTSMAVEAARAALATAGDVTPHSLLFATTNPPYADKTNATAIHAALDLPDATFASDAGSSVRSAVGALRSAARSNEPALVTLADVRTGLPGGPDESSHGDGAVAFLFGNERPIAELVATGHATREFLDRWRVPGTQRSRVWEERFGEQMYAPLVDDAWAAALKQADLTVDDLDAVAVTSLNPRAVRTASKRLGVRKDVLVDDLSQTVGNTGAAHPGLLLANVLDTAEPDQTVAVVVAADGVDVLIWRTTAAIADHAPQRTVTELLASATDELPYTRFLSWRGMLHKEPPRRPDPQPPAAPPAARMEDWKFAFVGSRCTNCATRHLPPQRVCRECGAVDEMERDPLADTRGTITTYTIDHLAYSESPPVIMVVVDFDGGGRFQCQLTDADADTVDIGDRVEMSFRKLSTADGVHNYFWKARPVRETTSDTKGA